MVGGCIGSQAPVSALEAFLIDSTAQVTHTASLRI